MSLYRLCSSVDLFYLNPTSSVYFPVNLPSSMQFKLGNLILSDNLAMTDNCINSPYKHIKINKDQSFLKVAYKISF